MDKEVSYIPLDVEDAVNNYATEVQSGETCRVQELGNVFAWMRGFVNGWYGWSNDGKGTFTDYMMVIKSKYDKWKWCCYKPEDMDTVIAEKGNVKIKANRIYNNLAWTLTGKTWNKNFAEKNKVKAMTLEEQMEALDFITEHFYIIHPKDRKYSNLLDEFMFMYEKYGIDGFMIDPWNTMKLPENERGDERLVNAFIDCKELAMRTNSVVNIINHARSMNDVKEKNGSYKVVNQFMQLGGSAWDMKMDGQYSIYRPDRHLSASDPKVHFYNLKQRQAEIVGVQRGDYSKIVFNVNRKQYYFNGVNPMDGSTLLDLNNANPFIDFSKPKFDDNPPF